MSVVRNQLLRTTLERSTVRSLGLEFAALFGSFRRGENTLSSDIDILLVCRERSEELCSKGGLWKLGLKDGMNLHLSFFQLDDFENRLKHHDYLLASLLADSSFLVGDETAFMHAKRDILTDEPSATSIAFNTRYGRRMFACAEECFQKLQKPEMSAPEESRKTKRELLLSGIRNLHLATGYSLAVDEMRKRERIMPLRSLLKSESSVTLRYLISLEKAGNRRLLNENQILQCLSNTLLIDMVSE